MSPRPSTADRYAELVAAFRADPGVTVGTAGSSGRRGGFGDSALCVNNKIFAMLDSRQAFVVKLPRRRVEELTASGDGAPLDFGNGRVMKEWLALAANSRLDWQALAREAREFVAAQPQRRRR